MVRVLEEERLIKLLAEEGMKGVPFVSLARLKVRVPQSATALDTSTSNRALS